MRRIAWDQNDVESEVGEDAQGEIELRPSFAALQAAQHGATYAESLCCVDLAAEGALAGYSNDVANVFGSEYADASRGGVARCVGEL